MPSLHLIQPPNTKVSIAEIFFTKWETFYSFYALTFQSELLDIDTSLENMWPSLKTLLIVGI